MRSPAALATQRKTVVSGKASRHGAFSPLGGDVPLVNRACQSGTVPPGECGSYPGPVTGATASDHEPAAVRPRTVAASKLSEIAAFFDRFASVDESWERKNQTYHRLLVSIFRFIIPRGASMLEIGSGGGNLLAALEPVRGVGVDVSLAMTEQARRRHPELDFRVASGEAFRIDERFDYVVLSDLVPYAEDLLAIFQNVAAMTHDGSRIVVQSYSALWRPVIRLAEILRLKHPKPIRNWVSPSDVRNLLELVDFEVVSVQGRILLPKRVPFLTTFLNGVVASCWPFSLFTLTYWIVGRPKPRGHRAEGGVTVVVPCRNEEGTIGEIVERVPDMGEGTEILFVEGGSTDDTRGAIEREIAAHPQRRIRVITQEGQGKGDAVRTGFRHAANEVLMILDGDLGVEPDVLPSFYEVLAGTRADFVNGSRLVYGREPASMRFMNLLANKLFSYIFTWLMAQPVKDTLCGTKALRRADYEQIAAGQAEFGDLDPFGDFDLLLGAARRGMKIVDLPVRYHARTYGRTNISRFRHGLLLLRMSFVGFAKLKVAPVRLK
jgi:SAM-dependent methyltransferase